MPCRIFLSRLWQALSASNHPLIRSIQRPPLNQYAWSLSRIIGSRSINSMYRPPRETGLYSKVYGTLVSGDLAALKKTLSEYPNLDLNQPFSTDLETEEAETLLNQVLRPRLRAKPDDIEIIKILLHHGCDINGCCSDAEETIVSFASPFLYSITNDYIAQPSCQTARQCSFTRVFNRKRRNCQYRQATISGLTITTLWCCFFSTGYLMPKHLFRMVPELIQNQSKMQSRRKC